MTTRKFLQLFLVAGLLLSLPQMSFAWKFASIADSRGSDNGVNSKVLSAIVDRINAEKVDLVIFSGDLVDSHNDKELSSELDGWKSIMSTLNCPYYVSVGNHDIPSETSANVIRDKFDFPANGPRGYEELVYSFDHNNAHFVCLDTEVRGDAHRLQPAQRAWLRVDLAHNKQPHVFVFAHDPAFPKGPHIGSSLDKYPTERDAFWSLISAAKCKMFFCGHEHLYARDSKDGVLQIINGTCGAPISGSITTTTDKYHYVIIDVDGNKVNAVAKDDKGKQFDSWSYTLGQ